MTIGVGDGPGAIALTNLPGERRVIESVDLWYSKGYWSKRPKVSLYGAQLNQNSVGGPNCLKAKSSSGGTPGTDRVLFRASKAFSPGRGCPRKADDR